MPETLADLPLGGRAVIRTLSGDPFLVERMQEMGFLPGEDVEVVCQAPGGDPVGLQIKGFLLSLRRDEARLVRVRSVGERRG